MNLISHPLTIGSFLGNGKMNWEWHNVEHSRLAVIGGEKDASKELFITKIKQTVSAADKHAVFSISDKEFDKALPTFKIVDLLDFEGFPTPQELSSTAFPKERMFFVASFIKLLCKKWGVTHADIAQNVSYRSHIEGPLCGYIRAIEEIQDEKLRETIRKEFLLLSEVRWTETENEGYTFSSHYRKNTVDKALRFLKGLWSFWAFTSMVEVEQHFLLFVEPATEFLTPDADPEIKQIISQAMGIMTRLTFDITCSTIVNTETLFPVPEIKVRYELFFNPSEIDFSKDDPFFPVEIVEEWKKETPTVGFLFDRITQSTYLGKFDEVTFFIEEEDNTTYN